MNAKLASVLLAVPLLVSAGIVAGAPITEQDSHPNIQDDRDADAEFGTDVVRVHQNETATIPISLNGTDTATVKIGSDNVNFDVVVTVTDDDGDGTVTLEFDTAIAETDQQSVRIEESESTADSMTIRSKTAPDVPPLSAGSYPLTLYLGNSTADDSEVAVGTMMVLEPETTTETTPRETTEKPTTTDVVIEPEPTTRTTDDASGDVPGFGPVVAMVALVAAAILAGRR